MTDGFALYGSPHSLFTYKVALMLRLSGAPFSFRYVSFRRGMHRTPEFLAMSRWGQVPVLRHGAKTLVQSPAILEYLAAALGKFQGDDSREWLCWDADRLTPPAFNAYGVRLGELKLLPLSWHPEVAAYYRRNGETAWTWLDDHLAAQRFIEGTQPTVADIACYGAACFARMSMIDLAPWPHVTAWAGHIEALPDCQSPLALLPMQDAEFDRGEP